MLIRGVGGTETGRSTPMRKTSCPRAVRILREGKRLVALSSTGDEKERGEMRKRERGERERGRFFNLPIRG